MRTPTLSEPMRQRLADKWTGAECTFNDKPATVVGRRQPFATVNPQDYRVAGFEWAWEAVDRIMQRDGKFYS